MAMVLLRRPGMVILVFTEHLLLRPYPRQLLVVLCRAVDMADGVVDDRQIDKHQEKRHCLSFVTPDIAPDGHKIPF